MTSQSFPLPPPLARFIRKAVRLALILRALIAVLVSVIVFCVREDLRRLRHRLCRAL